MGKKMLNRCFFVLLLSPPHSPPFIPPTARAPRNEHKSLKIRDPTDLHPRTSSADDHEEHRPSTYKTTSCRDKMVAALCIIILVASVPLMVYAMVLEQVNASLKSENRRLHASLLEIEAPRSASATTTSAPPSPL